MRSAPDVPDLLELSSFVRRRLQICVPVNVEDPAGTISDEGVWRTRLDRWTPDGTTPNPYAIFWAQDLDAAPKEAERLLPTSRFGHVARSVATLTGVAASMTYTVEDLRRTRRGAPPYVHFDMTRIVESYFDTMIIASILRCVLPHEAWWGDEQRAAEVVRSLWERVPGQADRAVLVGELSLATSRGVTPPSLVPTIRELTRRTLSDATNTQRAAVRAAAVLVDLAFP